jgi:hypothetical protein
MVHRRRAVSLAGLVALGTLASMAGLALAQSPSGEAPASPSGAPAAQGPGVVTVTVAIVGDPGNHSVGVVQTFATSLDQGPPVEIPAGTGIYADCSQAPGPKSCLTVGEVDYEYGIGELEITVDQYVTFLNTVDPEGRNHDGLYDDHMNTTVWPKYGPIAYSADAAKGAHYAVAYPEWADKPFNFGSFRRGARFVNSLTNGEVLSRTPSSLGDFQFVTYTVKLSHDTEQGMYDMTAETPTRTASSGFVLPSNDEWVKAAYYDPKGGGTFSYWAYPTGPFDQPNIAVLDPGTGDVVNGDVQPLSNYNPNDPNSTVDTPGAPAGTAPTWCPSQAGPSCNDIFPPDFPPGLDLPPLYMGNVSTVGQTLTRSPWGTLDQGGNVVEHTDTIAPQPAGYDFTRDWRYYHGGVANAPAYQVEISAFGYFPGDPLVGKIYPWMGFRVGIIGDLK